MAPPRARGRAGRSGRNSRGMGLAEKPGIAPEEYETAARAQQLSADIELAFQAESDYDGVRAENPVHDPDQQSCPLGHPVVMINGHVLPVNACDTTFLTGRDGAGLRRRERERSYAATKRAGNPQPGAGRLAP